MVLIFVKIPIIFHLPAPKTPSVPHAVGRTATGGFLLEGGSGGTSSFS